MQGPTFSLDGQTLALVASIVAAAFSAWTRAAVATLRADLTREQEQRCTNCETNKFAGRGEFDQLDTRVSRLEGNGPARPARVTAAGRSE